ncbi:hypothetical protein RRG08_032054 [Elysia crispata]|uniref:Reverse transcriptase domain-containing protein n=1 Tax=Elysia crispata TaxID=231223 RepID=A0AAE1DGY0_9GAST|nr:hypothetical protein RRG08_032054 [Elysia crispata]
MAEALARTGIDRKDIRFITELYWDWKAAIRLDQELSESAAIQRGVRQRCVLFPYLFNRLHTVYLLGIKSHEWPQHQRHTHQQYTLVDDTILLANSNQDLQKILDVVKNASEQKGLDMNVKKTKTMVIIISISKNEDMLA